MRKRHYLENDDLADALMECRAQGDVPTEKVCVMFRSIARHLLGSPRFSRYGRDDKEEMVSAALEKSIRNIKNWKPERRKSSFNYFTMCCEQAFFAFLAKHYKYVNQKRAALEAMKAECGEFDPRWEEQLDQLWD